MNIPEIAIEKATINPITAVDSTDPNQLPETAPDDGLTGKIAPA
jgi:hypothetical protein